MAAAKAFDVFTYESWAAAKKTTLMEKGLWDVVEKGFPSDPSKNPESADADLSEWRMLVRKDMEALEILQSSLSDQEKKSLSAYSAKEVWDNLQKGYELEQSKLKKMFEEDFSIEKEEEEEEEEIEVEYLMLLETNGDFTYDDDMWMVCLKGTTNHMTPYEKYFTNLDRTHKAKVGLVDGKVLDVQGKGDVKIVMKGGKKKTITNVLYVPGLNRNVLSSQQLIRRGYSAEGKDRKGAEFGGFMCDERGLAHRLNVVEANREAVSTYDWNVCFGTAMHRSPYEKVFTSLDRRQKDKAIMEDDSVLTVEGKGDVKIVMEGGKEVTFKNVLFIPGMKKNFLSLSELGKQGFSLAKGSGSKCIINDETGAELGETTWEGGNLALRLHIIQN